MSNLTIERYRPFMEEEVECHVRDCFWDLYRSGALEHLLRAIRKQDNYLPELEFVLKDGNEIIGQNIFFPGIIESEEGNYPVLTMGPVCISKKHRRKGYGKLLVEQTMAIAKSLGYGGVCIEGDYAFYRNCGFTFARDFALRYKNLPEGMEDSFFLAVEFIPGYLSRRGGLYESPYSPLDLE